MTMAAPHRRPGRTELTDPWVALEFGTDPAERVRTMRSAHERFTAAGTVTRPVRSVVAESWRRSVRARVSPEGTGASVELTAGDLGRIGRSIRCRG
ncbi:transcriptional regulator [Streptomyces alboflavus]|uniref:Transcriptional regulator n=1 Tax=Streptomyces alboflavus TaxID=67267 RepID=A0A1Z1WQT5_9ACTN|nr:transcriptional regulator [Streptomyces alboflavus]